MTDETDDRLERLNDAALQEILAVQKEMNDLLALEAQGADEAVIQERRNAVMRKVRDMGPQIVELQRALDDAKRKRA